MSKIKFLTDNRVLTSNISVVDGTANAQFPASNIKHQFTTKVFRSTGDSCSLLFDLGVESEIDTVALIGSCIDGIGFQTCMFEGSATPVFSGSNEQSVEVSFENNFAFKIFAPQSFRYWKLTFTSFDFVEVSKIYIGKATEMADNTLSLGFNYEYKTLNKVQKNNYNQKFIDQYTKIKTLKGDIKLVNGEEFDILNDIHIKYGENYPLWFMLDSDGCMPMKDSKFIFSGYFFMTDFLWKNNSPSLFDVSIQLEECT